MLDQATMEIREQDKADLMKILKHVRMYGSEEARVCVELTGLSVQRIRALIVRYEGRSFKMIGGRMSWTSGGQTSLGRSHPGIDCHLAVGMGGYVYSMLYLDKGRG